VWEARRAGDDVIDLAAHSLAHSCTGWRMKPLWMIKCLL
jgi:hypothetical protein